MTDQQPKHVFISYVRENQDQVDHLCADLDKAGVNVWLDRSSIKPGARWKVAIQEAIRSGNFFIACFSKEYTSKSKTYMNEELTLAIEELRQYGSDKEWFIPVLLSECDVSARSIGAGETLLDINWVSLYEDWAAGVQRIISLIKPIPLEIQDLIIALRSPAKEIRKGAIYNLGEFGPDAKPVIPDIVEALKDEYNIVRRYAIRALGEIGPDAKSAVPALLKMLKDNDPFVPLRAIMALGVIGPGAKKAVPPLIKALKDQNKMVSRYASEALEKINTPEAQKALEEYKKKSK